MNKGDKVKRKKEKPLDVFPAWEHLSINTEYEIEHVLENGLMVLKDFLMIVNKEEVDLTIKKNSTLSRFLNNMSNKKRVLKPKRVLCKRTDICGDPFYYDQMTDEKIERDNRMLVAGDWYDVVYNENDTDETFSIIDNQGNLHLHYMYTEEDKKHWPSFCNEYGPRDYAKWFYTPEELKKRESRKNKKL